MKRVLLAAATAIMVLASVTWMVTWAGQNKKEVVGLTPEHVRWFTPPYYKDGRQRAQLLGDSSQAGRGSIGSRNLTACVPSRIRIRKTN